MVDLMTRPPTFCQCFLRRDTRKLEASMMCWVTCSSSISTWPMATAIHKTFLSWNLMVDFTSLILATRSSLCDTGVGNLPALERPGPSRRGSA